MKIKYYTLLIISIISVMLTIPSVCNCAEQSGKVELSQRRPYELLLINSYHNEYKWTNSLTNSISDKLDESGISYELHITSINSKRRGNSQQWVKMIKNILTDYPPDTLDAILVTDDNAYHSLIRILKSDHNINIPIVFCGVSSFFKSEIADLSNITGVTQPTGIKETIDLALRLFPDTENIAFISDNTPTGLIYRNEADYILNQYSGLNSILLDGSKESLENILINVKQLPDNTALILGLMVKDYAGKIYTNDEICKQISAISQYPIFTVTDTNLGKNVIGGAIAGHQSQAGYVIDLILPILNSNGKVIPPVINSPQLEYYLVETQLEKWHLDNKKLPSHFEILSYNNTTLGVNTSTLYLISFLLAVTITTPMAIFYINQLKRKKKQKQKDLEDKILMTSLPLWCGIISNQGQIITSKGKYSDIFNKLWLTSSAAIVNTVNKSILRKEAEKVQLELNSRYYHCIAKPITDKDIIDPSAVFLVLDVTDKVKAKTELENKKQLLDMAFTIGKSCYFIWNIPDKTIEISDNFWNCQDILFRNETEIKLDEFYQNISPLDKNKTIELFDAIAEGKEDNCSFEARMIFSNVPIWFTFDGWVIKRDDQEKPEQIAYFMINSEKIKNMELKLQNLNGQLLEAQKMTATGSWRLDLETNMMKATPQTFKIFGIPYYNDGVCSRLTFRERLVDRGIFLKHFNTLTEYGDYTEFTAELLPEGDSDKNKTIWTKISLGTDEDNRAVYMGVTKDITDKVELENKLKYREQYLLQAATIAKMYYWNYDAATQQATVHNSQSIWGENNIDGVATIENMISYCHPDDRQKVIYYYKKIICGEVPQGAESYKAIINGKVRHLSCNWESFFNKDGSLESVFAIVIDISWIKEKEMAEIKQKEMEATAKAKGQFLATMSHEIRTPINVVIGMNHLLKDTELTETQYNFVNKIDTAANALLGIINDILDISKIEENKLSIENIEFSIRDILYNNASILATGAEKNNVEMHIKIESDIPDRMIGDPLRISQIITNLLSNAVKFTDQGEIILKAESVQRDQNKINVRFTISDTGIGIKPESLKKLFNPYSQAEKSTARQFGGTGLGLAICKQLTELMGGSISAQSTPSKGSSFIIELPFEIPVNAKDQSSSQIPELLGKNAIIVDDNHTSLEILSEMAIDAGFNVTLANNGKDAIEVLSNTGKKFELAIIDWNMPGLNGIDTIRKIKELEIYKLPNFIAVTSHANEYTIKSCLENGYQSIISKPINPDDFIKEVRKVFGLSVFTNIKKDNQKAPDLTGKKILVVEDQELNQEIIINLLNKTSARITVADNGLQAIDQCLANKFDLVLMDIQMPDMDGLEATRRIRKLPNNSEDKLPILAMTANAMQEDLEQSKEAGMNSHLTKPINPKLLYDVLQKYLFNSEARQVEDNTIEKLEAIDLPLNTYNAIKFAGGNKERYLNTLKKFIDNTTEQIENLNKAKELTDAKSAADIIHALKGTAGNIGADYLCEDLTSSEKILSSTNDEQTIITEVNNIIDELGKLNTEINNVLCETESKSVNNKKSTN